MARQVKAPKGQPINGVVLLDKPQGLSSNAVLQRVKRLFNARKAGHTGSLDPLATGLLPICFGQATKACEYLLAADKHYLTEIELGVVTDTYDAEGKITEVREVDVTDAALTQALEQFRGDITQIPPMYSALKQNGQPLYKLARAGKTTLREPRQMTVYALNAERLSDTRVQLSVHASSGFYVRSLAYDLGEVLGCGAHVVTLRRTQKSDISLANAVTFDALTEAQGNDDLDRFIHPVDSILGHLPKFSVSAAAAAKICMGQRAQVEGLAPKACARIYNHEHRLIAIGAIDTRGEIKTHKIILE